MNIAYIPSPPPSLSDKLTSWFLFVQKSFLEDMPVLEIYDSLLTSFDWVYLDIDSIEIKKEIDMYF